MLGAIAVLAVIEGAPLFSTAMMIVFLESGCYRQWCCMFFNRLLTAVIAFLH